MVWVIQISNSRVDLVLAHDLHKQFTALHMGIVVVDMARCVILTDEGIQILPPLNLCCHLIYIPKELFIST